MALNWYPGHMAKTKREIKENLNMIDIIYEVVDSRIPISSKIKDIDEIIKAFEVAKTVKEKPTCIIAKTIKGKGVSFMENQVGWHGKAPNDEEYVIAMKELEKAGKALCQK